MSIVCAAVALLAVAGAETPSDAPPAAVAVGQRVRVTSTAWKGRIEAAVASFDDTSLTVRTGSGAPRTLPWSTVSAMDVQVGWRRPLWESAAGGAFCGVIIGLVTHLDKTCGTPDEPPDAICSRGEAVALGALGSAVLGFAAQFLHSAEHYGNPKWKRLSPPFHGTAPPVSTTLRVVPVRMGAGVQVAVRF